MCMCVYIRIHAGTMSMRSRVTGHGPHLLAMPREHRAPRRPCPRTSQIRNPAWMRAERAQDLAISVDESKQPIRAGQHHSTTEALWYSIRWGGWNHSRRCHARIRLPSDVKGTAERSVCIWHSGLVCRYGREPPRLATFCVEANQLPALKAQIDLANVSHQGRGPQPLSHVSSGGGLISSALCVGGGCGELHQRARVAAGRIQAVSRRAQRRRSDVIIA
jgi:hypothetical protein